MRKSYYNLFLESTSDDGLCFTDPDCDCNRVTDRQFPQPANNKVVTTHQPTVNQPVCPLTARLQKG